MRSRLGRNVSPKKLWHSLNFSPDRTACFLHAFFSQGLAAAVIVTVILSIVLSRLNRNDHIGQVSETACERVTRVAERISNAMQSMPPGMMSGSKQDGSMTLQNLVVQEIRIGKFISLEVTDER